MSEIEIFNGDFFVPRQTDENQRDNVFKNIILKFAADNRIIEQESVDKDWTSIGKLYRLTNLKEGKKYTFQVGEQNPFTGELILAIIRGSQFYAVINFNRDNESIGYSMISFTNNSEVVYFNHKN
jgi:hypothetical protein